METKPNLEITYEATEHEKKFCQDPAFYVWDANGHQQVATVTMGDREVRVFCDGEMRINLWESAEACKRGDNPEVIRYCDRLVRAGIDTDEKLSKAFDEGRVEWVNNSWFDLYAYGDGIVDGWLDCVSHDLETAVLQASEIVESDEQWSQIQ